jgi:dienelactone hydrolase
MRFILPPCGVNFAFASLESPHTSAKPSKDNYHQERFMSGTTRIVDYEQNGQTYEGFLAMPEGAPKGVVLVAHAWGGQSEFEQDKAKLMASWGYAGFAADVYGKGNRGATNEECEALMTPLATNRAELQSRLAFALDVAKKEAGTENAAAIGFCFGGLCALDLARSGADIRAAISFHGTLSPSGLDAKEISARILVLHGYDDPLAPPESVTALAKELTAAGCDWQIHAYGHVAHSFTDRNANNPDHGMMFDAQAKRRSWSAAKQLLVESFAEV